MKTVTLAAHQRIPECDIRATRHKHPYIPGENAARRCTCGHRKYLINIGGALPPSVGCEKCGRENPTATAYERGLATGRRLAAVTDAGPAARPLPERLLAMSGTLPGDTAWRALLIAGLDRDTAYQLIVKAFRDNGDADLVTAMQEDPAGRAVLAHDRLDWSGRGYPPPWDLVGG